MSHDRMLSLIEADSMMGREPIDFIEVFEKGRGHSRLFLLYAGRHMGRWCGLHQ